MPSPGRGIALVLPGGPTSSRRVLVHNGVGPRGYTDGPQRGRGPLLMIAMLLGSTTRATTSGSRGTDHETTHLSPVLFWGCPMGCSVQAGHGLGVRERHGM